VRRRFQTTITNPQTSMSTTARAEELRTIFRAKIRFAFMGASLILPHVRYLRCDKHSEHMFEMTCRTGGLRLSSAVKRTICALSLP